MKRRPDPLVPQISRRTLLSSGISAALAGPLFTDRTALPQDRPSGQRPKRVAAVNSIFRLRSHAYHIVGRMVFGFQKGGIHHQPNLQVVRMYDDQQPADDLGPWFCKNYEIEPVKTVASAPVGPNRLYSYAIAQFFY